MVLNIILILFVVGAILFDFRTTRYLQITSQTRAIINLRRRLKPAVIIFIALMIFVMYKSQNTYSTLTQGLALAFVLLIVKINYFNKPMIVVNEKNVSMGLGQIPTEAISGFTLNQKGQLVITIQGLKREFKFTPKAKEDYDTVLYCAEELNIGSAREVIQKHRLGQIVSQARGVFPLSGIIKDYDWGGKKYIAQQLGMPSQTIAEVWYGTHPAGVSTLTIPGDLVEACSNRFYTKHPEQTRVKINPDEDYQIYLNYNVAYGQPLLQNQPANAQPEGLPFLMKMLDVARPLSIQIHPTKQQAEMGFEAEDKAGINLRSKTRTFVDRNHKPEFALALTDMYLLHGMDSKENVLAKLAGKPALEKLHAYIAGFETVGQAYKALFTASKQGLQEYLGNHLRTVLDLYSPLIERQLATDDIVANNCDIDGLEANKANLDPDYWLAFTFVSQQMSEDNLDVGLLSFYFLNLVKLNAYEGIFQEANVPHAYLRGRLVEVMATSDNVVRGGLTTKHINTDLYLRLVNEQTITPKVYAKGAYNNLPVEEFTVDLVHVHNQQKFTTTNAAVGFVLSGQGNLAYIDQLNEERKFKVKPYHALFMSVDQEFTYQDKDGKALTMVVAKVNKLPAAWLNETSNKK
ncbi:mannose-6-phosphate isomerase, class I [Psittacicella hinzii]|uniref:UPF0266 membrane protein YobD n=1 Tax=Psittacicella hinzii TaxID=2028575 RepID=A0A3A1YEW9_9GAMM|nr:mannose-6-phosphate isomerase, class I [Psittacicella hinzii]RIY36783.1 mannose-6-phosphate isomerase, class I [Psittacicella hinzii]